LDFFGTFPPPKKGGGMGWGRTARQGKRDKYRYEAECVTDVPISCILNRLPKVLKDNEKMAVTKKTEQTNQLFLFWYL
jgi:hypothetical protein